jgi:prophage antirepressor-like protein
MIEEIKEDNNCIVKAFENNPISILQESNNNKKIYYFKASDVGKVLNIVNIRTSIMNFDDDERVVRKAYDPNNLLQDTIFLSSQGVYRLLYNSKKEIAKKFRKWAGNILDDIIFNESSELKKQLQEQQQLLLEKENELTRTKTQLEKKTKLKVKKWYDSDPGDTVYAVKIKNSNESFIKLGKTLKTNKREGQYPDDMFHIRKCYNCILAEKVIHHILDKYRIEKNKEYFDITEDLAIYIIDTVCDFLDKFINFSEELPKSNIKENLNISLQLVKELSKEIKEPIKTDIKIETNINKIVEIKIDIINETDTIDKFINEFCEIDETYECLSYEILGAYRIWAGGLNNKSKKNLSNHLKLNYKSKSKFYIQYNNSSLLTYFGIRPKQMTLEQENKDNLPKYEEFILTECKYNYNYRIGWTDFVNEFKKWTEEKYPMYNFSNIEKINMNKYINRHFLKDSINMSGYANVPGIWGFQLNNNNNYVLQSNNKLRKNVYKINVETNTIIEEYESLTYLSQILNVGRNIAARYIKIKKIIDNCIYQYKEDIELQE